MGACKHISHNFSLDKSWMDEFVGEYGFVVSEFNGSIYFQDDENTVKMHHFCEVLKGKFSVLLSNMTIFDNVVFTRRGLDNNTLIVYHDFSNDSNLHTVGGNKYEVGANSDLNFGLIDNRIKTSYQAKLNNHVYSLRLIIDKTFLLESLDKRFDYKYLFDSIEKEGTITYYGSISNVVRLSIQGLNNIDFNAIEFEYHLKSVALKVFHDLLFRFNTMGFLNNSGVSFVDIDSLEISKSFLHSLKGYEFPGLNKLASLSNMSVSSFKTKFKILYGCSPALYFKRMSSGDLCNV
ncbi:helix-turn-helix transcriptional regulator [Joostella atrarenae]|uniref:Helix-turn-helix transcriptional regulator n=1 Tax=Joostella atrarenae TaxID=679257 RepID=A0ABS9J793_9FLAO|nr:hypothetical protein [Joostella atrarenae]MCF8716270.1 helix-turn-helix transcriptional regulator [Joostella atrarenae]